MAGKYKISYFLLIVMVAAANSNVINVTNGVAGLEAEAGKNMEAEKSDLQNGNRKFHWPGSIEFSFHRTGEVGSDGAADAEQQLGQNDTEHNHHHHHHHHHNNSANGNDTQSGDTRFRWPGSMGIVIHRAVEVGSEAGQNDTEHNHHHHHHHHHHNNSANGNDTQNGDTRFRWPSSVGIVIHRAGEVGSEAGQNGSEHNHHHHHHHNHHYNSANGNDTQNGGTRFRWPSSMSFTIHRAGEVGAEDAADAEQQLGQNDTEHNHYHDHHHHHNNSANGNATQNGGTRFRWPSSIGISIHRAGEVGSEAAGNAEQQIEGLYNHQHSQNHSANGNDTRSGENRARWPFFSLPFPVRRNSGLTGDDIDSD